MGSTKLEFPSHNQKAETQVFYFSHCIFFQSGFQKSFLNTLPNSPVKLAHFMARKHSQGQKEKKKRKEGKKKRK